MTTPARLRGAAAESHAAGEARREAERIAREESTADRESLARIVCATASRIMGIPAPDALQALGNLAGMDGPQHAARVLRMAGLAAPGRPATASGQPRTSGLWARDPDHHPEVMAALARGASPAELATIRREAAAGLAPARPSPEMWETRDGTLYDGTAPRAMVQTSRPIAGPEEVA